MSRHPLRGLALLLLLWPLWGQGVTLTPTQHWPIDLFQAAPVLYDPLRQLGPDEALARLAEATPPQTAADSGNTRGQSYWLRTELRPEAGLPPLDLVLANLLFEQFHVYLYRDGEQVQAQHVGRPATGARHHADIDMRYLVPLDLQAGRSYTLLLRVEANHQRLPVVKLMPAHMAQSRHTWSQLLVLTLFGGILGLVLYNLVLASSLRDTAYVWYALHAIGYLLFFANSIGLLAGLVELEYPRDQVGATAAAFIRLFALLFAYQFLDIPRLSPTLRMIYLGWIALTLAQLLLQPLLPLDPLQTFNRVSHLLLAPLVVGSALYAWWCGFTPARFVVLGWLVLMLFSAWTMLALLGAVGLNSLLPLATFCAVGFEMLTLSLALADRIKLLQAEMGREEEQNRSKSLFLATLSHEIRSPLSGMLGLLDLLRRSPLSPAQREATENLHYSGQALLGLVDNLLDYSRVEHGQITLTPVPFEPRRLAESLTLLYATHAAERGLSLTTAVANSLPTTLEGDTQRIRQVLINLLDNAIRFSQQGEVCLTVRPIIQGRRRCQVEFVVSDQGPGIAEHEQRRIFARFYRVAQEGGEQGSGLGLPVSREIVRHMGGELRLMSQPGVGSRFSFILDLAIPEGRKGRPPTHRSLQVLLADDDPLQRTLHSGLLRSLGHQVIECDNGQQVLERFAQQPLDLVLLDMRMPGLDGITCARALRARDSQLQIGLVTAGEPPNEAGLFDHVLHKPVSREALVQMFERLT